MINGKKVTHIGDRAFPDDKAYVILLPQSIISIGDHAVSGCRIYYEGTEEEWTNIVMGGYNYPIYIIEYSQKITDDKVVYCEKDGEIAITNYFGKESDIVIPPTIEGKQVTSIGSIDIEYSPFAFCDLESITLPDSLTKIECLAFSSCKRLESITLPDSVTSIGEYAFSGCKSLKSIKLPDSMTEIGDGLFYNCESLKSIKLPDGITEIGESTFYNCSNLESVTFPNSLKYIGKEAFFKCTSLRLSLIHI